MWTGQTEYPRSNGLAMSLTPSRGRLFQTHHPLLKLAGF
jgi:hypothetical protein